MNMLEKGAAAVHEAYLETCDKLGWPVKPENRVPYSELSEDSKELDRATFKAAINALMEPTDEMGEAAIGVGVEADPNEPDGVIVYPARILQAMLREALKEEVTE